VRRTIENARASAEASAADLANARLSAQSDWRSTTVQMRQLDEEKAHSRRHSGGLPAHAVDNPEQIRGRVAARSDVLTAQSQLQSTQADRCGSRTAAGSAGKHAIAILVGVPPAELGLATAP